MLQRSGATGAVMKRVAQPQSMLLEGASPVATQGPPVVLIAFLDLQ